MESDALTSSGRSDRASSSDSLPPLDASSDGSGRRSPVSDVHRAMRSSRSRVGQPRRTLSLLPMSSTGGVAREDANKLSTLQERDLVTNWHIPFDKLRLLDVLGKGSFKGIFIVLASLFFSITHSFPLVVVHRGTYLDTTVAIGQIMGVASTDFVTLENELRIMQHIRHPNTLLFIGVSFDNDNFYIVTELAPLGDLGDLLLKRGKELSWKTKLRFSEEIAHALAYLHDRGVFHRDLKSENVLVFPGDNDGYLLKVADFGLGFLSDKVKEDEGTPVLPRIPGLDELSSRKLPHIPTRASPLAQSQVGTVWIRAPEVDSKSNYSAQAVDVFSFGMVLVDILTDGQGEDIRWDVTYQKKDPVTGKSLLEFGIDTDKMHAILSRSAKRPAGLIQLAVECCNENPSKRPQLSEISQRLAALTERYTQTELVRVHLEQQLQKRETQALAASAAIRSDEGTQVWAGITQGLTTKDCLAKDAWDACLDVFDHFGEELSEHESAVVAEACGASDEGRIDAATFGQWWERLGPILGLLQHEQVGWLWRQGFATLFSDRVEAVALLHKFHNSRPVVVRISNSFPGKLTVSLLKDGKPVHLMVTLDAAAIILGKGVECKTFAGLNDLMLYLKSLGFESLISRNGETCMALTEVASTMPKPISLDGSIDSGYDLAPTKYFNSVNSSSNGNSNRNSESKSDEKK